VSGISAKIALYKYSSFPFLSCTNQLLEPKHDLISSHLLFFKKQMSNATVSKVHTSI